MEVEERWRNKGKKEERRKTCVIRAEKLRNKESCFCSEGDEQMCSEGNSCSVFKVTSGGCVLTVVC